MKARSIASVCILALFSAFLSNLAMAAEVHKSDDPECRIDIEGPIELGDLQKIEALKDHLIIDNGESTSAAVVCLDSPGGNLVEGLKLARFFLEEGVGTRIRANKECQSVCAIMFMMGNARGSEVSFLNRRMHVTSILGFHRPYLSIDEASLFTSGDVEAAYDIGVGSIYELMSLANRSTPWHDSRMIEPDLMELMTGTPGSEMFVIRTVEQAIRWQIEVDGLPNLVPARRPHVMFACENALSSGMALTSVRNGDGLMTADIFEFAPANSWSLQNATNSVTTNPETGRFVTVSPRSGYSSIGCEVAILDQSIAICGHDESSDIRIGDCRAGDDVRYFGNLISQHPLSDLRALALFSENQPDAVTFRRCRVLKTDGSQSDDEVCLHSVNIVSSEDGFLLRHVLEWASGSRTVVDIGAEEYGKPSSIAINGQPGEIHLAEGGMRCVRNTTSGNRVCSEAL